MSIFTVSNCSSLIVLDHFPLSLSHPLLISNKTTLVHLNNDQCVVKSSFSFSVLILLNLLVALIRLIASSSLIHSLHLAFETQKNISTGSLLVFFSGSSSVPQSLNIQVSLGRCLTPLWSLPAFIPLVMSPSMMALDDSMGDVTHAHLKLARSKTDILTFLLRLLLSWLFPFHLKAMDPSLSHYFIHGFFLSLTPHGHSIRTFIVSTIKTWRIWPPHQLYCSYLGPSHHVPHLLCNLWVSVPILHSQHSSPGNPFKIYETTYLCIHWLNGWNNKSMFLSLSLSSSLSNQ